MTISAIKQDLTFDQFDGGMRGLPYFFSRSLVNNYNAVYLNLDAPFLSEHNQPLVKVPTLESVLGGIGSLANCIYSASDVVTDIDVKCEIGKEKGLPYFAKINITHNEQKHEQVMTYFVGTAKSFEQNGVTRGIELMNIATFENQRSTGIGSLAIWTYDVGHVEQNQGTFPKAMININDFADFDFREMICFLSAYTNSIPHRSRLYLK